jgi:hypothetical protein
MTTNYTTGAHGAFTTITLPVPEHWLPALFGVADVGDAERRAFTAWAQELREMGPVWSIGLAAGPAGAEPERFFAWDHEGTPYGVDGCMCYDVNITWRDM